MFGTPFGVVLEGQQEDDLRKPPISSQDARCGFKEVPFVGVPATMRIAFWRQLAACEPYKKYSVALLGEEPN